MRKAPTGPPKVTRGSGRRVPALFAVMALLALLGAFLVANPTPQAAAESSSASVAPPSAGVPVAAPTSQPSSIVVVRREGGRDALWRDRKSVV